MALTIARVIEQLDRMKPNKFDDDDKIRWLSALDGKIFEELFRDHEGLDDIEFEPYGEETSGETELLVQGPYEDIYLKWLFAQVDRAHADASRYSNTMRVYNYAWADLANWVNRTYRHKSDTTFTQLM